MEIGIGSSRNTFALMPIRELSLLLDPSCLPYSNYAHVIRLVSDLRTIDSPITIKLLIPNELLDQAAAAQTTGLSPPFFLLPDISPSPFNFDSDISSDVRDAILTNTADATRCLGLLSVADAIQADGIVTADELLIEARYQLYQHHRIRVIPLNEFGDTVEVFA